MKKVFLQFWEEAERGYEPRPIGCSIHLSEEDCFSYVKNFYKERTKKRIPNKYDRVIWFDDTHKIVPIEVMIKPNLYAMLEKRRSIRLAQHQTSNLLKLMDIRLCN